MSERFSCFRICSQFWTITNLQHCNSCTCFLQKLHQKIMKVLETISCFSACRPSSKKLNGAKGYSLKVFSALRLFLEKRVSQKPPFNFLIFSDGLNVEKTQRVLPSSFFGFVRLNNFFLKSVPNSPIL